MSTVRTIAKNTLSLTIAEVITKILAFILVIFVARYLGDVGYGKYAFALAFTSFFAIIADPGFSILMIREVARNKELAGKYLGNISLVKFVLSFVAFLLVVIFINLMHYPPDTTIAVYIAGAYVVLTSFNQFFISIFRAFEKMEYEAVVRIFEKVIVFSLVMSLIYFGYGLIAIVSALLISSIFSFVFSGLVVLKKFTKPKFEMDFSFLKHATKEALPFGLTVMFVVIYFKIDTVMLSMMKGDAVVGWYNAAYNIIFGLMALITPLTSAIFPVMSRYFKTSEESFKKTCALYVRYMFMLGLPISIGVTLLSDKIILLLYGTAYTHSIVALQILIWSFFIICTGGGVTTLILNSINRQRIVTGGASMSATLNILLNLLLIPSFSLVGAAIATFITEVFGFVFEFHFVRKHTNIQFINGKFISITFASVIMGLFIIYFNYNLFLTIILATLIYVTLLFMSKAFSKDDLKVIRKLFIR